jgi:cytochrome c5
MNLSAPALLALLAASTPVFAETDDMAEGRKVFESVCARCHESGIMGAPVVGNPEEWEDAGKVVWSDVKFQHLENGYLREAGKKAVTDHDVEVATGYMLTLTQK